MKRLQIMIDEDLDAALERQARAEGTSKAALIRTYVRAQMKPMPPVESDPLWDLVGSCDGSSADSTSIDDVVYGPRG